jgi:flagellar biosynthesis protein
MEQDKAPVVIASGYGPVAERIINIAEQRGIPVFRDDSAASMLCMLEVGANIPEELYQVVATIYVQILQMANRIKGGGAAPLGGGLAGLAAGVERAVAAAEAAEAAES